MSTKKKTKTPKKKPVLYAREVLLTLEVCEIPKWITHAMTAQEAYESAKMTDDGFMELQDILELDNNSNTQAELQKALPGADKNILNDLASKYTAEEFGFTKLRAPWKTVETRLIDYLKHNKPELLK